MATIRTQHFLFKVANSYIDKRKTFSKEEIVKKINQIKYLSEQKKVPKLTLRKEIIHLENKLQSIFDLEKQIFEHEKNESLKVAALKKEIIKLKSLIMTSEDKDLSKKVDKLSHVLGDALARKKSIEDIALSKQVVKEISIASERGRLDKVMLQTLENKLQFLKQQLNLKKDTNPAIAKMLEEKIILVEEKLKEKKSKEISTQGYTQENKPEEIFTLDNKPKEVPVIDERPKHVIIFEPPQPAPVKIDIQELERELPLPPPPRI